MSTIVNQKGAKLRYDGIEIITGNHYQTMTYGNYAKLAKDKAMELFENSDMPPENVEDMFWEKICILGNQQYALNNEISLFDENTVAWNLDRFTEKESIIHAKESHHNTNVSVTSARSAMSRYIFFNPFIFFIFRMQWPEFNHHLLMSEHH